MDVKQGRLGGRRNPELKNWVWNEEKERKNRKQRERERERGKNRE